MIKTSTKTKKNDNFINVSLLLLVFMMGTAIPKAKAEENRQRFQHGIPMNGTYNEKPRQDRFQNFSNQNRERNDNSFQRDTRPRDSGPGDSGPRDSRPRDFGQRDNVQRDINQQNNNQRNIWQSNPNQAQQQTRPDIPQNNANNNENRQRNYAGEVLGKSPYSERREQNNNWARRNDRNNQWDNRNTNQWDNRRRENSEDYRRRDERDNNRYQSNRSNNWNYSYGGHNYNFDTQKRGNFRYNDRNSNNYWGPNGRWSSWDNRWGNPRDYARRWGFDEYDYRRGWRKGNNWYAHPSYYSNWGGWYSFFLGSNGIWGFSYNNNYDPYYANYGNCMRLETTDYINGSRAAISFLACENRWHEWEEVSGTRRIEYWLY